MCSIISKDYCEIYFQLELPQFSHTYLQVDYTSIEEVVKGMTFKGERMEQFK